MSLGYKPGPEEHLGSNGAGRWLPPPLSSQGLLRIEPETLPLANPTTPHTQATLHPTSPLLQGEEPSCHLTPQDSEGLWKDAALLGDVHRLNFLSPKSPGGEASQPPAMRGSAERLQLPRQGASALSSKAWLGQP